MISTITPEMRLGERRGEMAVGPAAACDEEPRGRGKAIGSRNQAGKLSILRCPSKLSWVRLKLEWDTFPPYR